MMHQDLNECLIVHLSVIIILHCIAYFVITYVNMHFFESSLTILVKKYIYKTSH